MFRYKIVETETPYVRFFEVYERFLGFLWWRKWDGFRVGSYNEAKNCILTHKITYKKKETKENL